MAVFSATSLLVTTTLRRRPPSSAFSMQVAWKVVPEPAKKSMMRASGRSRTTAARQSLTAYTDFGKGNVFRIPSSLCSRVVPWVPASWGFSHQTVFSFFEAVRRTQ